MDYRSPFLNSVAEFMLARRYSKRTVSLCITWIKAFINYNDQAHPDSLERQMSGGF